MNIFNKNLIIVSIIPLTAGAIDEEACQRLARNQTDNVIPNYQPLNQGSAGLCSSFAMGLSISGALKKHGNEGVSPLDLAKSIEDWGRNTANVSAAKGKVNFIGDAVSKDDRFAAIENTINTKLTDDKMSSRNGGVTADAKAGSANYGVNRYSNQEMEGVSLSELSAAIAAKGKACSQDGSKFAGVSFADWTSNGRSNFTSFTDMEDDQRDNGDASFLMGQLSFLYDANKKFKRSHPAFETKKLSEIIRNAKLVCDRQVTSVVVDHLQRVADGVNPCKAPIRFGENDRNEVCKTNIFRPQLTAAQFVQKNKAMLTGANGEGMKEIIQAMERQFLATQVSQAYADEVNGNILGGKSYPEAYIPHSLAQKIQQEEKTLAGLPDDNSKARKDAEYRLGHFKKQAEMIAERGQQMVAGESAFERALKTAEKAVKEETGADLSLKTNKRPIHGNPREYDYEFYGMAKNLDPSFATNEVEIEKIMDKLTKLEGRGNSISFEQKLSRSQRVSANRPETRSLLVQLEEKLAVRQKLLRDLNKKNLPSELLNGQGDFRPTFSGMSQYLTKAAVKNNELKPLMAEVHNAALADKIGREVVALSDSWSRKDKRLSPEEFKVKAEKIAQAIRSARLDPSYKTLAKGNLSEVSDAELEKLLSLDPSSSEMGDVLYRLKKAKDSSYRKSPYDFLKNVDLDNDGKVDDDSDSLAAHEPFKSNDYAKALFEDEALKSAYKDKYNEIMTAKSDHQKNKTLLAMDKADLQYKNLNDCLSQRIQSFVHDSVNSETCDEMTSDLIYSLTSLASLTDDTDRIVQALDEKPEAFWDQVISCDQGKDIDLSGLSFDVYQLSGKDSSQKEDLMAKALEDSVVKGVPLTVGMCLDSLSKGKCADGGQDNHAMAVVGYSANWDPQAKKCNVQYKLANSWGKRCDNRVENSKLGVSCDTNTGIISVPSTVMNTGAIQLSVSKILP